MTKGAILVCGHGPGISDAVARRFGREGFSVAIAARNGQRLNDAALALTEAGITAQAFPCDLGDVDAVRALVKNVRTSLGPISVVHWNAYGHGAGDLTTAPLEELRTVLDVCVVGMVTVVQEALVDLKNQKGAVLVTGGGLALDNARMEAIAAGWSAMGLAVAKAAQHKAAGVLREKLANEGVYVGEVVVMGLVKGAAYDRGGGTLSPLEIADKFWDLHQRRDEGWVKFG